MENEYIFKVHVTAIQIRIHEFITRIYDEGKKKAEFALHNAEEIFEVFLN